MGYGILCDTLYAVATTFDAALITLYTPVTASRITLITRQSLELCDT